MQDGSLDIKVNDGIKHYFQIQKGFRQSDLMSLIFFNIVRNMLAILIAHEMQDKKVSRIFLY